MVVNHTFLARFSVFISAIVPTTRFEWIRSTGVVMLGTVLGVKVEVLALGVVVVEGFRIFASFRVGTSELCIAGDRSGERGENSCLLPRVSPAAFRLTPYCAAM